MEFHIIPFNLLDITTLYNSHLYSLYHPYNSPVEDIWPENRCLRTQTHYLACVILLVWPSLLTQNKTFSNLRWQAAHWFKHSLLSQIEQGDIPDSSETSQCVTLGKNNIPLSASINKANNVYFVVINNYMCWCLMTRKPIHTSFLLPFKIILVIYPAPR